MKSLTLTTYLKIDRIKSDGTAPVWIKIKANGTVSTFNTKSFANPKRWIETDQFYKSRNRNEQDICTYLGGIKDRLRKIEDDFIEQKTSYSAEMIKNKYFGKGEINKNIKLWEIWELHKADFKLKIESGEYKPNSYKKYNSVKKKLTAYIKEEKSLTDVPVRNINNEFQRGFHSYLTGKVSHNISFNYLKLFRAVIAFATGKGYLDKYPLENYSVKQKPVKKTWLTIEEIHTIANKKFACEKLEVVRDYWLFSVYTGYSYADTYALTPANVVHENGEWLLLKEREKTGNKCDVLLIPEARQLIEKYKNDPRCIIRNKLFPMCSNQKANDYLKLIAADCKIDKCLTYHVARNSLARILSKLGNDVYRIKNILGHSRVQQTEHYIGSLNNSDIIETMNTVKGVFAISKN